MEKTKVNFHSIKTRICSLIVLAIVVTGILMVAIYSPNSKKQLISMAQNYLDDLAYSYGAQLDSMIEVQGIEATLSSEYLEEVLAGIGLKGIESSYVYVVSPEGIMLYHPTPEKIGEPVENAVVKGVVSTIQSGGKAGEWCCGV